MRFFHRHKWKTVSIQPVESYGDGWGGMTELPTSFKTYIMQKCVGRDGDPGCGDVRSKKLNGTFKKIEEV